VIEQFFFDRIPVEPGHGAESASDGGPGAAAGLQVTGEQLNVRAAGLEQMEPVLLAPARVLPQVQLIRLPGQAAIPSQEPS
jgi:hypothetical protein